MSKNRIISKTEVGAGVGVRAGAEDAKEKELEQE
jgi:hypothetical protein